jgi:hypothetical protein
MRTETCLFQSLFQSLFQLFYNWNKPYFSSYFSCMNNWNKPYSSSYFSCPNNWNKPYSSYSCNWNKNWNTLIRLLEELKYMYIILTNSSYTVFHTVYVCHQHENFKGIWSKFSNFLKFNWLVFSYSTRLHVLTSHIFMYVYTTSTYKID